MGDSSAIVAAMGEAVAEFDQLAEDERQLGLFSEPVTEGGRAKMAGRTGLPGRPLGAKNKRTEATVAMLLGRYRDPRAVALERVQMHPADLAAMLGCTVAEADDKQRLWAQSVYPFLHARITPEVVDNRQIVHLHFGRLDDTGAATGGDRVHVLDPEQYQRVSDAETEDV